MCDMSHKMSIFAENYCNSQESPVTDLSANGFKAHKINNKI